MKILIVEDEARIAKRIERMTREILGTRLHSIAYTNTLHEALSYIKNNSLDLVFLDLNLNGENGFDVLSAVVSGSFHTIIISAYKDQAITAFEHGVLDFVPKPFNQTRLEEALSRFRAKGKNEESSIKFLAIKKRGRIQLISIDNLIYIKGAGVYTELFMVDGSSELHDKSLEKLEQLLPPGFVRIHKSYLVRMSEIKEIVVKSGSKYLAELNNGIVVPIGRTKYKEIKAKWI